MIDPLTLKPGNLVLCLDWHSFVNVGSVGEIVENNPKGKNLLISWNVIGEYRYKKTVSLHYDKAPELITLIPSACSECDAEITQRDYIDHMGRCYNCRRVKYGETK